MKDRPLPSSYKLLEQLNEIGDVKYRKKLINKYFSPIFETEHELRTDLVKFIAECYFKLLYKKSSHYRKCEPKVNFANNFLFKNAKLIKDFHALNAFIHHLNKFNTATNSYGNPSYMFYFTFLPILLKFKKCITTGDELLHALKYLLYSNGVYFRDEDVNKMRRRLIRAVKNNIHLSDNHLIEIAKLLGDHHYLDKAKAAKFNNDFGAYDATPSTPAVVVRST